MHMYRYRFRMRRPTASEAAARSRPLGPRHSRSRPRRLCGGPGPVLASARYYTPEITKVKFRWNMPLKIQWAIPVQIHRVSDNPLGNNTDVTCENPLEHATDNRLENATEHPRWFPRCWFLVCNLLPLTPASRRGRDYPGGSLRLLV